MNKIVYLTGSRADYGRAKYFLNKLQSDNFFKLIVIPVRAHLEKEYGDTLKHVKNNFVVKHTVKSFKGTSSKDMSISLGLEIIKLSKILDSIKPEGIILFGDRGEMLAGAIVAKHLNIPIFHIGGGFSSGSIDNYFRDAISVFSDIHLVANQTCKKKVASLGVDKNSIYIVGAPDLEAIRLKDFSLKKDILKKYQVSEKKYFICMFHPVTDELSDLGSQMEIVCQVLSQIKEKTIFISPNADAGGEHMSEILKNYVNKNSFFKLYKHIPYEDFLSLLNSCSALIGNSSAGIIEAPSFCIPVINIGSRQNNRERSINIIDTLCQKDKIIASFNKIKSKAFTDRIKDCKNVFGDGLTSQKIVEIIRGYFKDE